MVTTSGKDLARRFRFYTGITLLVLSMTCPLFGIVVAQFEISLATKASIIGLLSLGIPEILILMAAAVLGRENYEVIKAGCLKYLKRLAPSAKVGKLRYKIGLVMFILPLIPTYVQAYVPKWLPDTSTERLYINLAADGMFIASLFVLGGDFWEKLRALFVYEARVQFPNYAESLQDKQ
mgnify:CR=1 FL=1